ncbi:MAG: hypothetical protein IIW40_02615 [Clostridia bacterium]|nr:hypothetical protein [Clostridia bacterium]
MNTKKMTPWQRVAALEMEGFYFFFAFLLRLGEWLPFFWLVEDGYPADPTLDLPRALALGLVGLAWLLQGVVLPPLRLGRLLWYAFLVNHPSALPPLRLLFSGWKRWGAAVSWRGRLWWRRTAALCLACLPPLAIWYSGLFTDPTYALLWLLGGGICLVGGVLWVWLWQSRYAMAPLLIAEGWPAGAALQLSARAMRKQKSDTLCFWMWQFPIVIGCFLPVAGMWLLPSLRQANTARLLSGRQTSVLPTFSSQQTAGGCILRPSLL